MNPMISSKGSTAVARKPYQKPRLEQVRLVPGQAVLEICKNPIQAGPGFLSNCGPVGAECESALS